MRDCGIAWIRLAVAGATTIWAVSSPSSSHRMPIRCWPMCGRWSRACTARRPESSVSQTNSTPRMPVTPPGWPTRRMITLREAGVRPRFDRMMRPPCRRRSTPVHRSRTTPLCPPLHTTPRSPTLRRSAPAGRSAPNNLRPVARSHRTVLRRGPARRGRSRARRGIRIGRHPIRPGWTGGPRPVTPVAGPPPFRRRHPRRHRLLPTAAPRPGRRTHRRAAERHRRDEAIPRGEGSRLALRAHREGPNPPEGPDLPVGRSRIPGPVRRPDPTVRPATRRGRMIGAALASSGRPTR